MDKKIENVDWESAKKDGAAFISNNGELQIWSTSFFKSLLTKMIILKQE